MATGWSEKVREVADRDYVQPARQSRSRIRIRFGDLRSKMIELGLPPNHPNQVASPLESAKFWEPRGLEMCTPKGQPRKVETILEFRFVDAAPATPSIETETSEHWAERVTSKLRGLLKKEIATFGGAEGYMKWVRSEDHEEV